MRAIYNECSRCTHEPKACIVTGDVLNQWTQSQRYESASTYAITENGTKKIEGTNRRSL